MASISTSSLAAFSRRRARAGAVARSRSPSSRRRIGGAVGRRRASIRTIRSGPTTTARSTRRRWWRSRTPTATTSSSTRSRKPGERRDVRALNVNTVDEVPDSSWFTNRIGRRDMTVAEVVSGPDRLERVSLDGWVVSGGKSIGRPARLPHDRSGRAALSDRGRPAVEPRAGERRRDHRHRLLSRHRLQHRRRLPGGDRSRGAGRSRSGPRFAIR